jgi:FkbM family methyltransferase
MNRVKIWLKEVLLRHEVLISRPPGQYLAERYKLARLKGRGLRIESIIDGGAAEGSWTRMIKGVYPGARVLCIEPRGDAQLSLEEVAGTFGSITVVRALLGAGKERVLFNESGAQSSVLPNSRGLAFGTVSWQETISLDDLVSEVRFPWPDYIKLDLQGAELLALSGAQRCMQMAQAVQLEASFLAFQKDQPVLADVVSYMRGMDYECYDILALWHRPLDGALAQGDFLFLRRGHPLRADCRWSEDSPWA